jgi:histidinol-phosphatase (PHP family)
MSFVKLTQASHRSKNIPKELVRNTEEQEMLMNLHTHTTRCRHASGEDREYVLAAIEAGYEVLGFADHCPWVYPDAFVSGIRMRASETDGYFDSLLQLRREYEKDIQIRIGFEAEYMPPLMDAQTKFLSEYPLDYMILGQHFIGPECNENYVGRETKDGARLTAYVDLCIEGAKTGKYLYLAHPDVIHFIGDTAVYEKEMRRLCKEMKAMDIPLEMNVLGLATGRNYPDSRFWEIAKETGNKVILGMDAHDPAQLKNRKVRELAEKMCEGMEHFIPAL